MRVLVTAGPTREHIDAVRFITNASSGRMGCALAAAAVAAGHEVTLLLGPCPARPPGGCRVIRFVSVADLKAAMQGHFADCDALVMAAAVGDFTVAAPMAGRIKRSAGPVTIRLEPTEDLLAGLAARKRPGQVVVAFAVEEGSRQAIEAGARGKMAAKGADYVVVNAPAAMGEKESQACVLSPGGAVVPWALRSKEALAAEIVALLGRKQAQ
jgi:phosphopantothenoylcysteine decarboxylase/phosphopantothenate--cysteine ligase